jgi:Meiotically up-regulated gene 113/Bacterial toxin YdaS
MIYFARTLAHSGFVKIGTATNVKRRIAGLSAASPFPVVVIRVINGGPEQERWLHRYFAKRRVRREWFRFTDEMLTIEPPDALPSMEKIATLETAIDPPMAKTPIQQQCEDALQRAIKSCESISALARALDCSRQNVQQWTRIPKKHVQAVSRLTGIPKHELRPDLFVAEGEAAE